MSESSFEVVIVGGGLAGAALARAMSSRGRSVAVLERTMTFRDRIRGEWIAPWGVAEAKHLGLLPILMESCGHELPRFTRYINGAAQPRDYLATTRLRLPSLAFFHPDMQELMLSAARDAGAEVWRGAVVRAAGTDSQGPWVEVQADEGNRLLRARLVVGADGRDSQLRQWGGFTVEHGKQGRFAAGLMLEDVNADSDSAHMWINTRSGQAAYFFPQAKGRGRAYVTSDGRKFSGLQDAPLFIQASNELGVAEHVYAQAKPFGVLSTLDLTDHWVNHPFERGIALIGDAAGATDPTWGQGLSIALRDVRALADCLDADRDWAPAGHLYATERDRYFGALLTYESWVDELIMATGRKADERRARAMALWAKDPSRIPDIFTIGPENTILDEHARQRYFGEDNPRYETSDLTLP
jgi:2-polyprenyl-6-methoxyphenol hydroxylase-like FAD-dependent oxidoreductase